MPQHYPRPTPARRVALGLVQAGLFAAGLMALTWFIAAHCLTVGSTVLTFALFMAAFAPLTLTATWRGPRGTSRPLKFATFGLFFAALVLLALTGPDTMCTTAPSAVASALYVAIAGLVIWGALLILGPDPSSAPERPLEPGETTQPHQRSS